MNEMTVTGIVTCLETTKAVADAEVRIGLSMEGDCDCFVTHDCVHTAADGSYRATLIWDEPERVNLIIQARGVEHCLISWPWQGLSQSEREADVHKVGHGDHRVVDMALSPGFSVKIQVQDNAGRSIQSASSTVICTSKKGQYCNWPLNYRVPGEEGVTPITNADGEYLWQGFSKTMQPGERYVISVQHPDYVEYLVQKPEALPREGGVATAVITLQKGIDVFGRATTPKGDRISGALIEATLKDDSGDVPICHQVQKVVTTGADGSYRIPSLAPGTYCMKASHKRWGNAVLEDVVLPQTEPIDVQLIAGASAAGYVRDAAGNPVSDATVWARWKKPTFGRCSIDTDAEGYFVINGLPKRHCYCIYARVPDESWSYGYFYGKGMQSSICFDQSRHSTITGRLMHPETGRHLEERVVCIAWSAKAEYRLGYSSNSEPDGRFSISVPAGKTLIILQTESGGFFAELEDLSEAEEQLDLGDVIAKRGTKLVLNVVDAVTKQPINGALASIDIGGCWRVAYGGETKGDGTLEVTSLPPFNARIQIVCDGYKVLRIRNISLRNDARRVFNLEPE